MLSWIIGALLVASSRGQAQAPPRTTNSDQLPVSAFLDSAALVRSLGALSVPEQSRELPPLFNVRFDSTGAVEIVESVLEHTPASYAEPVASVIRTHVRADPSFGSMSAFLLVIAGPEPYVERKQILVASPHPTNMALMSRASHGVLQSFHSRRDPASLVSEYPVQLKFRVQGGGSVDASTITLLSSSGDPELDREALQLASGIRFTSPRLIFREEAPESIGPEARSERVLTGFSARSWVVLPFQMGVELPAARERERSARRWHGTGAAGIYFGNGNGPFLGCYLDPGQGNLTVWIRTGERPANAASRGEGIYESEWKGEMAVSSGSASAVLPARIIPVATGGALIMANVNVNEPVIAAFGVTGQISVSASGESRTPPAAPLGAVVTMLSTCRRPE
jgi:hypothetical protein